MAAQTMGQDNDGLFKRAIQQVLKYKMHFHSVGSTHYFNYNFIHNFDINYCYNKLCCRCSQDHCMLAGAGICQRKHAVR